MHTSQVRNCFLPPIPELELSADLLAQAADALLAGDTERAGLLVRRADDPTICEYEASITGPIDPAIHWQYSMPENTIPKSERAPLRMPAAQVELSIYERDGWRCRFCGCRVIAKKSRAVLIELFPEQARWGRRNAEKHCALSALTASLDHVVPHSRGGSNDTENLVTACGPCQFGRSDWTLEEVGVCDPRTRLPVVDSWDGLTRLLKENSCVTPRLSASRFGNVG